MLKFQVIDWIGRDERREVEEDSDSGSENDTPKHNDLEYVIRMFGTDANGNTVSVKVEQFSPYFFLRIPESWNTRNVANFLSFLDHQVSMGDKEWIKRGRIGYKILKKKIFWGFNNNQEYNVIQLFFKSAATMKQYVKKLSELIPTAECDPKIEQKRQKTFQMGGYSNAALREIDDSMQVFESNIDPMIRFIHERNILPSGWVQVKKSFKNSESNTKIDMKCKVEDVDGLTDTAIAPIKELMFDLEVNSSHGDFPLAKKDYKIFWNQLLMHMILQLKMKKNLVTKDSVVAILKGCLDGKSFDDIHSIITKTGQVISQEKVEQVVNMTYGNMVKILQIKSRAALEEEPEFRHLWNQMADIVTESAATIPKVEEKDIKKFQWIISKKRLSDERREKELRKMIDERIEELCTDSIINSMNLRLPDIRGDEIIQIGSTMKIYGQTECYRRVLISLGSCSPIDGAEVIECQNEKEVLLKWRDLVNNEDPDIVGGYNIFGFDMKYLYDRSIELGCDKQFLRLGRMRNEKSEFVEKKLSSSGLGDNFLQYISMDGRVLIDLMKVAQRDFKLDSYKLDFVSSTFMKGDIKEYSIENGITKLKTPSTKGLREGNFITIGMNNGLYDDKLENGEKYKIVKVDTDAIYIDATIHVPEAFYKLSWCESKDDVSPKEMFQLYRGSAADRSIIGKYCIQDCELCNRLMSKLDIIVNNIGMANVCYVPFSYLFMRGQGVKIFSLISRFCREENFIVPVITKPKTGKTSSEEMEEEEESEDDSFQGAFVLDPIVGIYTDEPVAVNDFNSLYPSCMISHNISHDTACLDKKWQGENGAKELAKLGYSYEDVTYDIFKGQGDKKVKIGEETTRYVQFANNEKGVIPKILMKLLKARKDTRKLQESEKDPFKWAVLEGLQLAYKVTANSLYGQVGASTSPVCMKRLAASTTAVGRSNLIFAKEYVEKNYPGSVAVYGDTDSIFFKFKVPEGLSKMEAIEYSMNQSIKAGEEVSNLLKRPHNWDFEKVICPFILLSKKRYVGKYYMSMTGKPSVKSMGIVLKRRDNAPIVKVVYGGVIDMLMKGHSIDEAIKFVQDTCKDILAGKYPIEKFIISKTLKANYKNPDSISHKALAMRMGERNPGNKPQVNDRIPFVYIKTDEKKKKILQSDKIEHPEYVKEKGLEIDYMFYITNQIMSPVTQIFEIKYADAEKRLFGDIIRKETNKKNKAREITDFFSVKSDKNDSVFDEMDKEDKPVVKVSKLNAEMKTPRVAVKKCKTESAPTECKHKCTDKSECKHACCNKWAEHIKNTPLEI